MAKTLLNGVNDVLKRHRLINGTTGELSSLTSSAIQVAIDLSVSAWNEAIIELYSISNKPMPQELLSATITLATGDRDYDLPGDLVQIRWPLIDTVNGQTIGQYGGGFLQMIQDQINASAYTGLPMAAAIRPSDNRLYMDRTPTADYNGREYTLYYDKELVLASASSAMPFNDTVYTMMVLPVTELVRRDLRNSFDRDIYDARMAIAASLITENVQETSYMPERVHSDMNYTDPLSE